MDNNETNVSQNNSVVNPQTPEEISSSSVSSEESYSSDYELYSKKPKNKNMILYISLGIITFITATVATLLFFEIIKF
jgi:hypothetical protein